MTISFGMQARQIPHSLPLGAEDREQTRECNRNYLCVRGKKEREVPFQEAVSCSS